MRAAHAAGLFVFQVPDLVQPAADVRGIGHPVVGSLREVASLLGRAVPRKDCDLVSRTELSRRAMISLFVQSP